jgi:hypothetical protein
MIVRVIFAREPAKVDLATRPAYSREMAVKKRMESAPRSSLAERILEQREGKDAEVSLERLEAELANASRYDIVASLKALEKAGQGQFIAGRKGLKARFVWGARQTLGLPLPQGAGVPSPRKSSKPNPAKPNQPEAAAKEPSAKGPARKLEAPPARKPKAPEPTVVKEPSTKGPARQPEKPASRKSGKPAKLEPLLEDKPSAKGPALKPEAPASRKPARVAKLEPVLDEELIARGPARKSLVPAGSRLERTKLSARDVAEPVSRVSRSLQHSFHLRPGLQVAIELPEDVTPTEVERFCTFLKALPFAGPRR